VIWHCPKTEYSGLVKLGYPVVADCTTLPILIAKATHNLEAFVWLGLHMFEAQHSN